MATLYITEFAQAGVDGMNNPIPMASVPPLAKQTVGITAGSLASNAFNADTKLVRVHADAICSIEFGAAPVAAATSARMAAGQTEYYSVRGGMKVAVITNT